MECDHTGAPRFFLEPELQDPWTEEGDAKKEKTEDEKEKADEKDDSESKSKQTERKTKLACSIAATSRLHTPSSALVRGQIGHALNTTGT